MTESSLERTRTGRLRWAYVGLAIGVLFLVLYILVIVAQGGGDLARVGFVAAFVGGAVLAGFAGAVAVREGRRNGVPLLYAAGVADLAIGFLAAMTIGAPLALAGALLLVAAGPPRGGARRMAVAVVAPLAILVLGIALT